MRSFSNKPSGCNSQGFSLIYALGPLLTYLADLGFVLKGMWERPDDGDPTAEPGTWEHFISVLPPWLWMLFVYEE